MTWQDNLLWFGRKIIRPVAFGFRNIASSKKLLADQAEDRTRFFPNTNINRNSFATVLYQGKKF